MKLTPAISSLDEATADEDRQAGTPAKSTCRSWEKLMLQQQHPEVTGAKSAVVGLTDPAECAGPGLQNDFALSRSTSH